MKRVAALFIALILLAACGKKEEKAPAPSPDMTTASSPSGNLSTPSSPPVPAAPPLFHIRDIDRRETSISFQDSRVLFRKIRQPIVFVTLFADWCPPCRGMLPYLSKLQKENSDELFVIGVLVNSDLDDEQLRRFMLRHDSSFFISNHPDNDALGAFLARRYKLGENYPLPLTLIFKNGRYVMHISGAAPYEMLQNLVDQLKEKKREE